MNHWKGLKHPLEEDFGEFAIIASTSINFQSWRCRGDDEPSGCQDKCRIEGKWSEIEISNPFFPSAQTRPQIKHQQAIANKSIINSSSRSKPEKVLLTVPVLGGEDKFCNPFFGPAAREMSVINWKTARVLSFLCSHSPGKRLNELLTSGRGHFQRTISEKAGNVIQYNGREAQPVHRLTHVGVNGRNCRQSAMIIGIKKRAPSVSFATDNQQSLQNPPQVP